MNISIFHQFAQTSNTSKTKNSQIIIIALIVHQHNSASTSIHSVYRRQDAIHANNCKQHQQIRLNSCFKLSHQLALSSRNRHKNKKRIKIITTRQTQTQIQIVIQPIIMIKLQIIKIVMISKTVTQTRQLLIPVNKLSIFRKPLKHQLLIMTLSLVQYQ